jgi:pimeloyl-ACP methyl ester carboxylesterase
MTLSNKVELTEWKSSFNDGHIQGYLKRVNDSEPTIHFLHGNGFSVKTYSQFLEKLENYNVIMQDAAGHGGSTAGKSFIGWNGTAERFNHSLAMQRKILPSTELIGMGHSFGGCMTVLMSSSDATNFDRMVLLDPAIFPPRLLWVMRGIKYLGLRKQIPLAKQAMRRRTQWNTLDQVKHNFHGRGTFKGWEDVCLDDYISSSVTFNGSDNYELNCPPWMESEIFSSYAQGMWKAIKKISVPTYIVQGRETFSYFKEAYRLAAKLNSNIKVVEIEGGHCFMQQNPAMSAGLVLDLLHKNKVNL